MILLLSEENKMCIHVENLNSNFKVILAITIKKILNLEHFKSILAERQLQYFHLVNKNEQQIYEEHQSVY